MKKLLNTLYICSPDKYLSLDGEDVVIYGGDERLGKIPLHTLEAIVCFNYTGASPALMGKCARENKPLVFLTPSGKFLARVTGKQYGNILLRKEQFRACEDEERSLHISKNIISAKLYNSSSVLRRAASDYSERLDADLLRGKERQLKTLSKAGYLAQDKDGLRGIEGEGANVYFSVFNELILQQKDCFKFENRNRRPPRDFVNAMLSFGYSLLTSLCVGALETVGLDPYAGFFHTDRPGRCSLALDLMEEFRAAMVDRFVLSLINKRMVSEKDFIQKEDGAVLFTEDARKDFLHMWQSRKKEEIIHPFLKEKVEWGLLPYVQAMLLAKYLRGDVDDYPPFLWK